MALEDRYDRTGIVKSLTKTENAAGGISDVEVSLVTDYRFFVYPPRPRDVQFVKSAFGLDADGNLLMATGEPDDDVVKDLIIVDGSSGERFKILGAHPQKRNGGITHHLAMAVMKMGLTASES